MNRINSTDVACPQCGVSAGEWCIGDAGYVLTKSHSERVAEARKHLDLYGNGGEFPASSTAVNNTGRRERVDGALESCDNCNAPDLRKCDCDES